MAGNNAIQFLRGSSAKRKASSESLLPGQPFYETDTNLFYVGGKEGTPLKTAEPIDIGRNGNEGLTFEAEYSTYSIYLPEYHSPTTDDHPLMYILIFQCDDNAVFNLKLNGTVLYKGNQAIPGTPTTNLGELGNGTGIIWILPLWHNNSFGYVVGGEGSAFHKYVRVTDATGHSVNVAERIEDAKGILAGYYVAVDDADSKVLLDITMTDSSGDSRLYPVCFYKIDGRTGAFSQ